MSNATFGAGCFWGVEETYRQIDGVTSTAVGFMGGTVDHPTYRDVCTGTTGHAEVVDLEYDETRISYDDLLATFWSIHDPTQRNRQGPDVGSQYRSVIFVHDEAQEEAARASLITQQALRPGRPIATEITAATTFWPAEEYHQQYLAKRGQTACRK